MKMAMTDLSTPPSLLKKRVLFHLTVSTILVAAIMLLTLGFSLYNIRSIGDANAYYTAAVKSMLQSWHNFFFIAAEPGGSVTVDKPPLGLWIEAVFGFLFGVSGVTLALPNILAGVLEIPVLYFMVKRYMGELAGVLAALIMAVTPVFVATHRNNTMDGMLVFTLLLAAWAFIKATESGQLLWALIGGFIMGLGFNIKMSEALLPLPAFYTFYFFCSKEKWFRKIFTLLVSTILFAAISLSWAIVVDRTPIDQRPFIGSSTDNTVADLIFQHNAVKRIFQSGASRLDASKTVEGSKQDPPPLPKPNAPVNTYQQETGDPGTFRFFTPPLSKQMSWLLPFSLISILFALFGSRIKLPIESAIHKSLILWGGWLATCLVFFSIIAGIFHSYYIIVMVPPFGATVAIGFIQLWQWGKDKKWAKALLILTAAVTLAFQRNAIYQYGDRTYLSTVAIVLLIVASYLLIFQKRFAYTMFLLAMLIVPAYWTMMTALSNADKTFPSAYVGGNHRVAPASVENNPNLQANQRILAYLQPNTQDVKYLVAVPSGTQGVPLVLTSERPVLYIGGYGGSDHVIDAQGLMELVARGDLRYVLYAEHFKRPGGASKGDPEILAWLKNSCFVVPKFSKVIIYTRIPRQPVEPTGQNQSMNPNFGRLRNVYLRRSIQSSGDNQNNNPIVSGQRTDYLTLYLCP
jgi:4-amino-4-deoxy-L-arabinose transferase-like glycosyltransferase